MAKAIRNLDYIRSKDPKFYEALADLIQRHQNLAQQVNGNPTGAPLPPPPIDGLTVTGQNGHFHGQIQHRGEFYRGIQYYAEYADNPGFQSPHTMHLGDSREFHAFLGNGTYYWRAYASYSSSPPSSPAYHGGAAAPQPVSGGGSVGPPALLAPQGSGTGAAGQGLSGPGPIPFRSTTGAPPVRGKLPPRTAGGSSGGSLVPGPATGLPAGMGSVAGSGSPVSGFRFLTSTQANLSTLAASLGALDANQVLVWVSDYDHILRWTGSAWLMIGRSAYIAFFDADPNPTTGWHLCDGSTVSYLNSDGSLTAGYVLPNMTGSPGVMKTGNANSGLNAATAPGISGSTASATTGITLPTNTGTPSATTTFPQGTGANVTVASSTHTHTEGSITDPGHTHGAGTLAVDATGQPANWVRRPWFRL